MNENENPKIESEVRPAGETADAASKSASREAFEELSEALKKAFRAGASDAKKAIDEAVPRMEEAKTWLQIYGMDLHRYGVSE